jgi:hypothetical protein
MNELFNYVFKAFFFLKFREVHFGRSLVVKGETQDQKRIEGGTRRRRSSLWIFLIFFLLFRNMWKVYTRYF